MDQPSLDSLQHFLSGTASPEEVAAIEAWYQSCMEGESFVNSLSIRAQESTAVRVWTAIANEIGAEAEPASQICPQGDSSNSVTLP